MKNKILLLLAFCAFRLSAQTTGDQIFDNSYIHEIRIESDDPNLLNKLFQDWTDNLFLNPIPYTSVKVTIDGTILDPVGVRVKGGSSVFQSGKRPFKLDFNEYLDGQEYDGLKKINLHAMAGDNSFQRELISYDLFKWAGVKGSRYSYSQVYVNDVLQGLYLLIEQIDKTFMNHYYANDEGTFYKVKFDELIVQYDSGVLDEYDEMIDVATATPSNELKSKLDTILNTDNFLKLMAVMIITNSVDNALDNTNFSLYHEPNSSLLYWVPWDLNLSLFQFANMGLNEQGFNPTFTAMMNVPEYRNRYYEIFCEMLQYNFTTDRLYTLIDNNAAMIRDSVVIDPHFIFSIDDFDTETQLIKDLIVSRVNKIQSDLVAAGFTCQDLSAPVNFQDIVINEFVASSDSIGGVEEPGGGFPDWIELFNNTNTDVVLDKFYLSDDVDFLKHWEFPAGTIIPANGYLIVWADRDVEEEGLHADFRLNKNSGQLFLSYEDMTILDSVTYSTQTTNVAYARIPNGVGDFVQNPITFDTLNEVMINTEDVSQLIDIQVFPNPVKDVLSIKINGDYSNGFRMRLIDVFGKVMLGNKMTTSNYSLDVKYIPSGIYLIEVFSDKKLGIQKVIIQD